MRASLVVKAIRLAPVPAVSVILFAQISCLIGGKTFEASPGQAVPSLAAVYQPFFPMGAAVEPDTLVTQGDLLAAQVNSLVAANAMKRERIDPRAGNAPSSYDFLRADAMVAFATRHGMKVRGHNLVWHRQVPAWVFQGQAGQATSLEALQTMREHIDTLLVHFRGSVYCWDVVNEALSDGSGMWRTDSPWFQAAGSAENGDGIPSYLEKAFEYARAADPSVKLFYNDYGIEAGSKMEKAARLVSARPRRAGSCFR